MPESISFYRNTSFDQPFKTQSGGLEGAAHGTSDYALDLVGERQMLTKMLLERAALLLAQLCEFWVGDAIILSGVMAGLSMSD